MSTSSSTTSAVESLEQYDDVVSWINDTLIQPEDDDDLSFVVDLTELDQQITQLLSALDIASEDTSTQLERIIDEVSRGVPRLAYDLHFMKDGASTLQNALVAVLQRSRDAVPTETSTALDNLHQLDTIKGRMEATREVLREAESWSTLEHEVTSFIAEKNYAKAAERLSEANKSMIVWQNTPEYDPRRTLLVNLQNQLEAALSTALLSAINVQDSGACKNYFAIFSDIQRESEFRNYYYASRRSSISSIWQSANLSDCDDHGAEGLPFAEFLPKFYSNFASLLNNERASLLAIFPDPVTTASQFISSTMSSLQPTMPQRLASSVMHHGDASLPQLIASLRATEEFATTVEKSMEKIRFSSPMVLATSRTSSDRPPSHRRRQSRMSISLRPGQHRSSSSSGPTPSVPHGASQESMEWDQELFQPFLDFQVDYGSLERKFLEQSLFQIIVSDTKEKFQAVDRPRIFRERAVDIFGVAEDSLTRCNQFTHGYGAVGLLQTLDNFFQSFFDMWAADVQSESHGPSAVLNTISQSELSDLDYTAQDWSDIQLSLHLLASARNVSDRLVVFETKLRNYLTQVANQFKLSTNDPSNFLIGVTRGESQLLEQSTLNSAELHFLLQHVDNDPPLRDPPFSATLRQQSVPSAPPEPLLKAAKKALSTYALMCQKSLIQTILSPLRKHLSTYPSLSIWRSQSDSNSLSNELKIPTFSLSPTETMQRVAEGLLNLPRLFEVYAAGDALGFCLETLPFLDTSTLKSLTESQEVPAQSSHRRRSSIYVKPAAIDAEAVSSAWLISLGHSFLQYLTANVLPAIPLLTAAGAAQLSSDLDYLSNIVRALNVEHAALDKWKNNVSMNDDDGIKAISEGDAQPMDPVLDRVSQLRGWR